MKELFRKFFPEIYNIIIFFEKTGHLILILGYLIFVGLLGYLIYVKKYLILVGLLGFLGYFEIKHQLKHTERKSMD